MIGQSKQFRAGNSARVFGCAFLFYGLLTLGAQADLKVVERSDRNLKLLISGTIAQKDAAALQSLSPELERNSFSVNLDSKGGDVSAGMQIGKLIRKYDGTTWIGEDNFDANCYSSCALIFISGVLRFMSAGGKLGLHRPYLAAAPQSRQEVEKQVPLMLSGVRQYITEMGITDNFYQLMVNTEPSQMVTYDSDTYTKLVPENDPVHQEINIAYDARHYGTTMSQMRQRELNSEACRKRDKGYGDCLFAAYWNLSERVYLERYEKARACRREDDFKLLLAMPKKERRDHPLWIKWETCERNVMQHSSGPEIDFSQFGTPAR